MEDLLNFEVFCLDQNLKLKILIIQSIFFNIHIYHKTKFAMINMSLKWHPIAICTKHM
jgi:hypothetical protein